MRNNCMAGQVQYVVSEQHRFHRPSRLTFAILSTPVQLPYSVCATAVSWQRHADDRGLLYLGLMSWESTFGYYWCQKACECSLRFHAPLSNTFLPSKKSSHICSWRKGWFSKWSLRKFLGLTFLMGGVFSIRWVSCPDSPGSLPVTRDKIVSEQSSLLL